MSVIPNRGAGTMWQVPVPRWPWAIVRSSLRDFSLAGCARADERETERGAKTIEDHRGPHSQQPAHPLSAQAFGSPLA